MTQPNRLTIEEADKFVLALKTTSPHRAEVYQQLTDTMRENERLKEGLESIVDLSEDPMARNTAQNTLADAQRNKHPLPVDGVCKCECNSTIREIYNGAKLRCTKCGGDVLANSSQNPGANMISQMWDGSEDEPTKT